MHYSRPTLVSNWHKNREAEPKDYDFTTCPDRKRYLHKSTYEHFGTYKDADWSTTTESQMSQCKLKTVQTPSKMMTPTVLLQSMKADSDALPVGAQYKNVLPRHPPGYNKMTFETTHKLEYPPPYHFKSEEVEMKDAGESACDSDFRRRQSEFTDLAGHKRRGRNTWQDDTGVQERVGLTAEDLRTRHNPICPQ
ncbi:hypothetical protein ACEWY4_011876 [Coilia grayii]|uniref:Uncharacterized protein n=1 Tax=Coilia grayii TaxID=363190 RepID=A0ABD1JZ09_9TELE